MIHLKTTAGGHLEVSTMWLKKRNDDGSPGHFWARLSAMAMAIALATMSIGTWRAQAQESDSFQVKGKVLRPGGSNSAGGAFSLAGAAAKPAPILAQGGVPGEQFTLVAPDDVSTRDTTGCICLLGDPIFKDGFE